MFRFLLGAAVACAGYYVISNHPEWGREAVEVGRRQLEVATRNLKAAVAEDVDRGDSRSAEIDVARVERVVPTMERLGSDALWRVLYEGDWNRRAAAAQVLLVPSWSGSNTCNRPISKR
jgi:hypothetical protein